MVSKPKAVIQPNLGIFQDRPLITVPPRALSDAKNFRIKNGRIVRDNMGWTKFMEENLDFPVTHITTFFFRDGTSVTMFATTKDVFEYDSSQAEPFLLTPRYEVGTVDVSAADPAVVTTNTGSPLWLTNLKPGDFIHFGVTGQRKIANVWYEIDTVDNDDQLTLTTAVTGAPLVNQAYTARQTFTGSLDNIWDSQNFLRANPGDVDLIFLTNGVDDIMKWNGTDDEVTLLPSLGFTCKVLFSFKNMMIYGNVTEAGSVNATTIKNSDVGFPEELALGLASEFRVHDGVDGILSIRGFANFMAIYSTSNITMTQFVGTPTVFVFREIEAGFGPISSRLIAPFPDFHEFVSVDAIYKFNGVRLVRVHGHVFREVIRKFSPNRRQLAIAHFDFENGEVMWVIPLTSDANSQEPDAPPEVAYTQHYLETRHGLGESDPIMIRDLPATALGNFQRENSLKWSDISGIWEDQNFRWNDRFFAQSFPQTLFGDANGDVFILAETDSKDGADILSFARFGRRPVMDGRRKGTVRRIYPYVEKSEASGIMKVLLRCSDQVDGPVTDITMYDFDLSLPEGALFVSPRKSARFVEVEFAIAGTGKFLSITGYDIDATIGGER